MSATTSPAAPTAPAEQAGRRTPSVPRAGWMVIGAKEFGDHILSARFAVLVIILAIAAAVPLYFLSGDIRSAAEGVSAAQEANLVPALFIALFWNAPQLNDQFPLPSVVGFIALVGPLLGMAFAFDAINGERSNGTLPRLLSQPIHRDDVINGKFAAGLAVISMVLLVMVGAITAFALIRLGIVPDAAEVLRLVVWFLVTVVYIGLWLSFGCLLSVVMRRAATSALVGFGTWVLLTFLGGLVVSLITSFLTAPASTLEQELGNRTTVEFVRRLLPDTLYREASLALLDPQVTTLSTPATIGTFEQAQQQVTSLQSLALAQSFIIVWPQVVALVAMMVACFALAYVMFMRQEVRA